jgi:hypothetical protein
MGWWVLGEELRENVTIDECWDVAHHGHEGGEGKREVFFETVHAAVGNKLINCSTIGDGI